MVGASRILCLLHIPKAGGQTLEYLLRRHFGARALYVKARGRSRDCRADDLRLIQTMPFVTPRCLHGHAMKPYVDFEEFASQLVWFTMLRDPIQRYISQYMYNYEVSSKRWDVPTYLRNHAWSRNLQVRMIAGAEDLHSALGRLRAMACVGLMEEFDTSLLLMRERLGLRGMNLCYGQPRNAGGKRRGSLDRAEVRAEFDRYRDEVEENNSLDIELYRVAKAELWPQQVAAYGEDLLAASLKTEFRGRQLCVGDPLRLCASFAYRNLVYKPWLVVDRLIGPGAT